MYGCNFFFGVCYVLFVSKPKSLFVGIYESLYGSVPRSLIAVKMNEERCVSGCMCVRRRMDRIVGKCTYECARLYVNAHVRVCVVMNRYICRSA